MKTFTANLFIRSWFYPVEYIQNDQLEHMSIGEWSAIVAVVPCFYSQVHRTGRMACRESRLWISGFSAWKVMDATRQPGRAPSREHDYKACDHTDDRCDDHTDNIVLSDVVAEQSDCGRHDVAADHVIDCATHWVQPVACALSSGQHGRTFSAVYFQILNKF